MKLFTSATVKLAGWYLLILVIVSLLFSSIIFQVARSEVDTQLHKLVVQQDDQPEPQQYIADHISTSTNNLLVSLGYINLVVLLAGGACSYLLARITLRPIELAHNAQSRFVFKRQPSTTHSTGDYESRNRTGTKTQGDHQKRTARNIIKQHYEIGRASCRERV